MERMLTVGVCTYKRPGLLKKLLTELNKQYTGNEFRYSAVVVDNDSNRSAFDVVESIKGQCDYKINYVVEPQKSISRARNRIIQNVSGSYCAFIDDDEYPSEYWLYHLYKVITDCKADGVLGPVLPYFDSPPPQWLVKSGLCDRKRFKTGEILTNPLYTRTGNVLFSMKCFGETKEPFDNAYGVTGGEDTHYFSNAIKEGKKFVWCDEASVYELVPENRRTRTYYCQRALLRGAVNSQKYPLVCMSTTKSIVASAIYTLILPLFYVTAHHHFMKYLVKNCDHIGKLLGYAGIHPVKTRTFQS